MNTNVKQPLPDNIPINKLFSDLFGFHKDHFVCCIIGMKSSGKTYLTTKMLRNEGIDYDSLYIFSPSIDQPKYQYLIHGLNSQLSNVELAILYDEDENSYHISPAKKIDKIARNKIIQPVDALINPVSPRVCYAYSNIDDLDALTDSSLILSKFSKNIFVFDDILGINNKGQRKITSYITRGRHFNCSVFFLTQNYSEISASIKKNTDIFIFFLPFPKSDRIYFYTYYINNLFKDFQDFNSFINANLKNRYDFVIFMPSSMRQTIILGNDFLKLLPL